MIKVTFSDQDLETIKHERFNHPVSGTVSKNRLSQWYDRTAIQQIRPVDLSELISQRYWEKLGRVGEEVLQAITQAFFKRIWGLESPQADCLLFDTTNYYTFLASDTPSDLARRDKTRMAGTICDKSSWGCW